MDVAALEARLVALEQKVDEFEAKDEVRALLLEYCRLNDALTSLDDLVDLYTDDAVLMNPAGRFEGKEAVRGYLENFFDGSVEFSRHHALQPVIEIVEPGVARLEAYFIALLGKNGSSNIAIGRYDDTLVKTEAAWRYRIKNNEVLGITTAEKGWAHGFDGGAPRGGSAA